MGNIKADKVIVASEDTSEDRVNRARRLVRKCEKALSKETDPLVISQAIAELQARFFDATKMLPMTESVAKVLDDFYEGEYASNARASAEEEQGDKRYNLAKSVWYMMCDKHFTCEDVLIVVDILVGCVVNARVKAGGQ